MKHTIKYNEGYRYYVYVAPGSMTYFHTLSEAQAYAKEVDGSIGEVI